MSCVSPLPIASNLHISRPVLTDLLRPKQVVNHSPASTLFKTNPAPPGVHSPRGRPSKENRDLDSQNRKKSKKPAKLAIPDSAKLASFSKSAQFQLSDHEDPQIQSYENASFGVSSKRGRKSFMEDTYAAIPEFQGNTNQAFFGVFDGHGGRDAAKFVSENLAENVAMALKSQDSLENAVRTAYMATDEQFLAKRVGSGACSISALIKEGQLILANAGDCTAVLSHRGKAETLNTLHRLTNDAERQRIENLGGYVDCFNGVWRLQGTLAVSRGFGDKHLKQFVSSEPELKKLKITKACEFLILASDGLWDKVSDQEAIDCAREILFDSNKTSEKRDTQSRPSSFGDRARSKVNACNMLIQKACSRGNLDDITVMIVPLHSFSDA